MIKYLSVIAAVFAIGAMTSFGAVAFAKSHAVRHHAAVHHRAAAHHRVARHAAASEAGENEGSEEATSDGPGGHEDEPGAEVDHQFEGEE